LLKPEMLANAEIPVGKGKPTLFVPSDAIQQVNADNVVFVQKIPDHYEIRYVRIGETSGGRTPVLEGLKPGERVVAQGSFILKSQLLKSSMESE
jgi:cobalt-zinc-cadmium efflux system membrane fusion protein